MLPPSHPVFLEIGDGPEHSTLTNDAFPRLEFDFMLSNPTCGTSWKGDQERLRARTQITMAIKRAIPASDLPQANMLPVPWQQEVRSM